VNYSPFGLIPNNFPSSKEEKERERERERKTFTFAFRALGLFNPWVFFPENQGFLIWCLLYLALPCFALPCLALPLMRFLFG
jgi:hypothetical protein